MTTIKTSCMDCGKVIEVFFGKPFLCDECNAKRDGKKTGICPCCLGKGFVEK